jgi:pyruvate dehydrogenase E2 component (dihydrolipoamide acetyltransferase)
MTEHVLRMPRLGETMEEGRITGWLVKPGDPFRRGDSILEIETDKTIAEFPALGDGVLTDILASPGEMVDVGTPIARIDISNETDWRGDEESKAAPEPAEAPLSGKTVPAGGRAWVEADLLMPRLGETMEEGRISRWLKMAGDAFKRGDAIIEIETDKTVAEFPALADGRVVSILRQEGELVSVGEPIARIKAPGEIPSSGESGVERSGPQEVDIVPGMISGATAATHGRVRATPLARRLAHSHGLDIATIIGSGRRGRVEKADILAAAKRQGAGTAEPAGDVRFASLKRGRMAFLDSQGMGEPVLLLHGFAADRTTWAALQAGLRRAGRRVLVPDLPGHGLTEIEAAEVEDLAADLPELLDHLGVGRISVVAHSLGAAAGLALASRNPGLVSGITLIAPAGLGSEIDADFIRGMAYAKVPGEVSHLLRRQAVQPAELSPQALGAFAAELSRGRLKPLAEAAVGQSGQRVDTLGVINRLVQSIPLRVLFGLEDRIIPWQQVTALPPAAAIHLFARAGHMPQWDKTRDVLDILLDRGSGRG